ncbi:heliorhodopsin HeR [Paraconexibacter sp.]|uniref:heliorhodopsin HeR n=1 Tax=Paraconexibacter sp. TaxID=2949640 RepID=UPI0035676013
MASTSATPVAAPAPDAARRLVRLNVVVGLAHLAQAVLILILAEPASLPVDVSYLVGPPGEGSYGGPAELFALRVDHAVAAFLLLAAVDHLGVVSPWTRRWYLGNVARGVNPARWWEYSVSASIMVVLIAMLSGITEGTALLALFGVNAAMILFGLVMERVNVDRGAVDWQPFVLGCFVGAVPWLAIALQFAVSADSGDGVPGFVYGIFVSLFLLFNTFAINMWLQYRGRGRWADPAFAERVYLFLSLGAKSALAWQVYGGALAGS